MTANLFMPNQVAQLARRIKKGSADSGNSAVVKATCAHFHFPRDVFSATVKSCSVAQQVASGCQYAA